ncbi:putative phosphatidylinositol 4,5-bisphosphate-binding protein [Clavispora lusitaniae]|uniref:Phosphatidylinositol 4,5-bisphosphate-binding protein n=1 Tax=Clavispora lusitaniae TaxID=36911 RepID=A0AA91Q4U3_CLALS|nr:putative phosphatidylinositol 4,5-bisphosphate-binding protein [Clavispora lusitaniae]
MSDIHNPLTAVVPFQFPTQADFPTEIIAQRFQAYRYIIKDLVTYLRQFASVQEEIVRQQVRLQQAVGTSLSPNSTTNNTHGKTPDRTNIRTELNLINSFFLPIGNGSIQDIPTLLTKFHQQNIQNGTKTLKEINSVIIPKFEELRKDLLVKIKEIKNLQNDFQNTLGKEFSETKTLLSTFNHAVDYAHRLEVLNTSTEHHHFESSNEAESLKTDPYLAKLKLSRQLKRQLSEENYLYEAFKNLQTSSEKLESIVVLEIQNYLRIFLNLVEKEHSTVSSFLVPSLSNGFLAKEPNFEFQSFINRNLPKKPNENASSFKFIDLSFPARKLSDLSIPHYDSLVNVAVREGPLERRSKFLKSYSSGWYVLTCSYLHEFKSSDRRKDQTPVMSLALDYCSVSEHSKNDGKMNGAYKFVLYSKSPNGLIHRGHNLSFRCDTYQNMIEWYKDIKTLTSLPSPVARAKVMAKKLQANNALNDKLLSRTSTALSSSAKSLRSNVSQATNLQERLSPKSSHRRSRSIAESQTHSVTSSAHNPRISSTFSHRYQQSPKLSNLINSDGTIVTPIEGSLEKGANQDDMEGDTTHEATSMNNTQSESQSQQYNQIPSISLPHQNGNFVGQATPQQTIPQNYQYYLNQVHQQPQQFYDPVSQQFFTINAIPTSHMTDQQNQNQNRNQPMPQYFTPQNLNQSGAAIHMSPNVVPKSPAMEQGQFVAVPGDGKPYRQFIPHFPQHFNEGPSNQAPYPTSLGEGINVVSRQTTNTHQTTGDEQPVTLQQNQEQTVEDQVSKLAIDEQGDDDEESKTKDETKQQPDTSLDVTVEENGNSHSS